MTALSNAVACLLALAVTVFYWRSPLKLFKETLIILLSLALFCVYTYFAGDSLTGQMEHYPFRMLALALCFSTTALPKKRRRYLVMAQVLWLWVEFFGALSLYYRGIDVPWTRLVAISGVCFGSTFLSRISHEMEFVLMAYWIAIWVFF